MNEAITLTLAIFGGLAEPALQDLPMRTQMCTHAEFTIGHTTISTISEFPTSEAEYAHGLKFREDIGLHDFMIFDMGETRDVSFWMEDTPTPLDLLFFNEEKVLVHIAQETTPYSRAPITAPGNPLVSYVVEMKAGTAARLGLDVDETLLSVAPPTTCPETL